MGDFNDDEKVTDVDAAIMAAHLDHAGRSRDVPVPEPGTLVLLVSAVVSFWYWRRR